MPRTRKKPAPIDFESESITSESSSTESQESPLKRTRKKRVHTHLSDNYEGDCEQTPAVKRTEKKRIRTTEQLFFMEQFSSDENELVSNIKTKKKQIDRSSTTTRVLRSNVKKGYGFSKKAVKMERSPFVQGDAKASTSLSSSNVSEDQVSSAGTDTLATTARKSGRSARKSSTKKVEVEIKDDVLLPVEYSAQEMEQNSKKLYRRSTRNKRKPTRDSQSQSDLLRTDPSQDSEVDSEETSAVGPVVGEQSSIGRKSSDRSRASKRFTYEVEGDTSLPQQKLSNSNRKRTFELKVREGSLTKRNSRNCKSMLTVSQKKQDSRTSNRISSEYKAAERQQSIIPPPSLNSFKTEVEELSLSTGRRHTFEVENCEFNSSKSNKSVESHKKGRRSSQDKKARPTSESVHSHGMDTDNSAKPSCSDGNLTYDLQGNEFSTQAQEEKSNDTRLFNEVDVDDLSMQKQTDSNIKRHTYDLDGDKVSNEAQDERSDDKRLTYEIDDYNSKPEDDKFSNQAQDDTRLTYELDGVDLSTQMLKENSNIKRLTYEIEDGASLANMSSSERSRKSNINKSLSMKSDTKLLRKSILSPQITSKTDINKGKRTVGSPSGDVHCESVFGSGSKRLSTKANRILTNKLFKSTYELPKANSERKSLIPRKSVMSETRGSLPRDKENIPSSVLKRRLTYELDDTVNDVSILQTSTANLFETDVILISSASDASVYDSPKAAKNTSVYTIIDSSCEDNKDSTPRVKPSLHKIALFNRTAAERKKPSNVHGKKPAQVAVSASTRSPSLVKENLVSVDMRFGGTMALTSDRLSSPLHFVCNKKPADHKASSSRVPVLSQNYLVPVDKKFGHNIVSTKNPVHGRCSKKTLDAVASTSRSSPLLLYSKPGLATIQSSRTRMPPRVVSPKSKLSNGLHGVSKKSPKLSKLGFKVCNTSAKIQSKEEEVKAAANKQRLPKTTVDDKRNTLKGVRMNRRFELLMNMRKK